MSKESKQMCQENKEDIMGFGEYCFAEGLGKPRVLKYLYHLQFLATWLRKPFRASVPVRQGLDLLTLVTLPRIFLQRCSCSSVCIC